jgi:hypothetical protein
VDHQREWADAAPRGAAVEDGGDGKIGDLGAGQGLERDSVTLAAGPGGV